MNLNFDKATLEDVLYVAHNLRSSDREECNAHTLEEACKTLQEAFEQSSHAWAIKNIEGYPVGILGLVPAPSLDRTGIPWLLCTEEADAMPKAFAQYSQHWLDICHALYPNLFNVVPSTSTKTLAWLKHLGFTLGAPMPNPKVKGTQVTPVYKVKLYV